MMLPDVQRISHIRDYCYIPALKQFCEEQLASYTPS